MLKLVFPDLSFKEKAIDYIREFHEYRSQINGSGSLDRFLRESTYEEWLKKVVNLPRLKSRASSRD